MTEPAQIALRRERRLAELGTRTPICACCSETAIECLELHILDETLGSKTTEIRCRNCHCSRPVADHLTLAYPSQQRIGYGSDAMWWRIGATVSEVGLPFLVPADAPIADHGVRRRTASVPFWILDCGVKPAA